MVSQGANRRDRRRYHAPTRQAQARATRGRVLSAAYELFASEGFATTMRAVAERAGVSRATVELLFGTKAGLLGAVVDVGLAGDDEPVAILDRPWVAGLTTQPPPLFLQSAGEAFASGAVRVAPILTAIEEGAHHDAQLAELAARLRRQRTVMASWVVETLAAKAAVDEALTLDDAIDTVLVVLDPAVHRRLLLERHWSRRQLAAWLGRSLQRLLLR